MINRLCLPALATLTIILAVGCSPPVAHNEIRFAISQAPLTLDPRYATDAASERVNRLLYRQLVDFDSHARAIPALASWVRQDPLHYRFSLRPAGRTFHDGSRLIAADVVATYRSIATLQDAPHAAEFANMAQIDAIDNDTVDFVLHQPDDQFPARLNIGILPARLILTQHDFAHHPVGSGPVRFKDWHHFLTLERDRDHQIIELMEVKDPTVRVLKLLRGEADLLQGDLPPELLGYLKQVPEVIVQESPGTNFSYLGFNLQDPLLKDLRVRQAVAMAIDRRALISHALAGGTRSAAVILPPEHWSGSPELPTPGYDPELARDLLLQAGIRLPLKLVLKTSTDAQRVRLATIMQGQMKAAGISLEIRSLDWGTFYDDVQHGKFQLYGLTWVGVHTPEIYRLAFHSQFIPPAGANRGRLQDAVLDQLLDRHEWKAAAVRVNVLMPYVPLWYEGQFAAWRQGIADYSPAPDGNWDGLETLSKK